METTLSTLETLVCTLVGNAGFRAVLRRAAHLTAPSWPWISTATLESEAKLFIQRPSASVPDMARGSLEAAVRIPKLAEAAQTDGLEATRAGVATLLAHMILLLSKFIGEDLTFRLLCRVWSPLTAFDKAPGPKEAKGS